MGKFLKAVVLILFSVTSFLLSQSSTITAEGMGMSEDAAIESAKRSAVETGIGTVMSSETIVKNSVLFSDNIFAKAQGFVKTFRVIDKNQGPDGLWIVTIEAEVTEILDQILQDEVAVQTLLNAMNRPKIVFLIREQNLIDNTPTDFAETKLVSMFYEKGFDVVDRQLVQALRGDQEYAQALVGNVTAAAGIASQLGAEVVVIGTAKISSGGQIYNMTSGQADINAKIVRSDTGEILAIVPQARGKQPHISPSTAGINAVNQAAGILGQDIIGQLIRKWSTQQANAINVFLVVTNVDFSTYVNLASYLKSQIIPGIRNAFDKGFNEGVAEYQILYEGKSQDLAMALMQFPPENVSLQIKGLSGNRISAEVVQ
ncbi:MAG: hypothetical protein V3U24_07675 [Candidatus Neomarinimicrobiota bacterium]